MRNTTITADAADRLLAVLEPELPTAHLGEWTAAARCTETDPEVFFPPRGDRGNAARAICEACEVRLECLAYAVVNADIEHGIWGGLSRVERLRLRNTYLARKSPARPPDKDAA